MLRKPQSKLNIWQATVSRRLQTQMLIKLNTPQIFSTVETHQLTLVNVNNIKI